MKRNWKPFAFFCQNAAFIQDKIGIQSMFLKEIFFPFFFLILYLNAIIIVLCTCVSSFFFSPCAKMLKQVADQRKCSSGSIEKCSLLHHTKEMILKMHSIENGWPQNLSDSSERKKKPKWQEENLYET